MSTRAPPTGALYARRNSVWKGQIDESSLKAQLHIIGDNPRRFPDHPLKTVGEVVLTRRTDARTDRRTDGRVNIAYCELFYAYRMLFCWDIWTVFNHLILSLICYFRCRE